MPSTQKVDVALVGQAAPAPGLVVLLPDLLQPHDGAGGEAGSIGTEQGVERVAEVAGRDALEIEPRQQLLHALGPPQVRRQQLAAEAVAGVLAPVAEAGLLDRDRADAGLDLAPRQISVSRD